MRYVIIGNSAAGVAAAEAIRALDSAGHLTMISSDEGPPYSRCLLPYYLEGKISEQQLYFRPLSFYKVLNLNAILGKTVVRVRPSDQRIVLDDGKEIPYDKLLVATGAVARMPPIPGREIKGVFTLRHLRDTKLIYQYAQASSSAVVIGGGLVGVEAAAALKGLGLEVAIVEFLPYLIPQALDERGAFLVQEALESCGLNVFLGRQVVSIMGKEKVSGVVLNDGRVITCDLVVVSVGVKPAYDLLQDIGAEINAGIKINDYMETTIPNIYAAGDVAEHFDLARQESGMTAVWPAAVMQGHTAGFNMAGLTIRNRGYVAVNAAEICGLRLAGAGLPSPCGPEDAEFYYLDSSHHFYSKIVTRRGRIVGMTLVGKIEGAGILTNLIVKGENVEGYEKEIVRGYFQVKGDREKVMSDGRLQPGQLYAQS